MHRVLVVDDEELYLRASAAMLRKAGFTVEVAQGGERALELLAEQPFDAALIDLMMPRMNGIELVRKIQARFSSVNVVLTSAFPLSASQIERLGVGKVGFASKPAPLPDLVTALLSGKPAVVPDSNAATERANRTSGPADHAARLR
jgi:CheY-like chemotaxis protein